MPDVPTVDEMVGIDPGFTGAESTDDYIARMRGRLNLLTEDELDALELIARFTGIVRRVIGVDEPTPVEPNEIWPNARHDWAEAAHDIHHLQHLIMAQAAARAYPEEFRLLGKSFRRDLDG